MPPSHPQLHPRAFTGARVSNAIDGISASLGTAEVIGIVGAIILAVVIVVLVCVMYRKKDKEDAADAEKNASIDAWSGSDMPAGELRRDEAYEQELRRGKPVPCLVGVEGCNSGEAAGKLNSCANDRNDDWRAVGGGNAEGGGMCCDEGVQCWEGAAITEPSADAMWAHFAGENAILHLQRQGVGPDVSALEEALSGLRVNILNQQPTPSAPTYTCQIRNTSTAPEEDKTRSPSPLIL
ncbi:hypothetical protein B0T18DRAFT_394030 [Schizothecium vesticola]|uniref:Uncharacterized protein n=1 Tax=Schizothecium vesticola TaxID=314040 RepID=A0AA40K0T0_9PEZI|nr:hypothetical protein B0T18DRAFT_394030 [Schizothecium vesticola]